MVLAPISDKNSEAKLRLTALFEILTKKIKKIGFFLFFEYFRKKIFFSQT